jgi:adiponectin receptor
MSLMTGHDIPTSRGMEARKRNCHSTMSKTTSSTSAEPLLLSKGQKEIMYAAVIDGMEEEELPKREAPAHQDIACLLHYDQIPEWQRDNEYILTGYRSTSESLWKSFSSIFALHNETISINSHLAGSALFYALPFYFGRTAYARTTNAESQDYVVFSVYFINVATCFLLSSICHIIWNHSPSYGSLGNKLDYLGIILLMWGASIPSIYYGFFCDPTLQKFYWILMTAIAITCAVFTCTPRFCSPKFRAYRAAMYFGLGLTGVLFATHGVVLHGWHEQNQRMSLNWMMLMAILNLVGAGMYAARLPEKRFPFTFDIVGGSHQIFHFMVIFAGLAHYVGLLKAFDYTRGTHGSCILDG